MSHQLHDVEFMHAFSTQSRSKSVPQVVPRDSTRIGLTVSNSGVFTRSLKTSSEGMVTDTVPVDRKNRIVSSRLLGGLRKRSPHEGVHRNNSRFSILTLNQQEKVWWNLHISAIDWIEARHVTEIDVIGCQTK